jgi:uncharacterized protein YwgA
MNDLLGRLEVLRRLLERGGRALPWCGKLAVQKLVYLLQSVFRVGLGYGYGLHHLGPYSVALANDLSLGEQVGLWRSRDESYISEQGSRSGTRFEVRKPDALPELVLREAEQFWTAIEASVEAALAQLEGLQGRSLELIATIHYLRHVQQVRQDQLVEVLRILKPKYSEPEIRWGEGKLVELEQTARAA